MVNRLGVLALVCLWAMGCGGGDGGHDSGPPPDTGGTDARPGDGGPDGGPGDGGADTGPTDAGTDTGPVDSGTDTSPPVDAGSVVEPGDPGAADVRFDLDTTADRRPISPYIYGHNQPDLGIGVTMMRAGGNRWTAYNWENNASNAGSDWCHQNDAFLGGGGTPGGAVGGEIAAAHAAGAAALVTIPIQPYVAADTLGGSGPPGCSGDVANSGSDYLDTRFVESRAKKGDAFAYPPDTSDAFVYQDELVDWLEATYGDGPIFYSLDNEPDLWADTHARIHPDPVTYDELLTAGIEYATAIKDVAPLATVFGPVNFGWSGMTTLQDAPDAAGRNFLATYLAGMATAEGTAGRRLLDVLDFHWYPEARGDGTRITSDGASAGLAEARMQAPRSLWDGSYTEDSWISMWSTSGPIRLLPRLRELVDANYPGTEIAISEYYYGGGGHISGAVAEADVLGIFARERVFAAAVWHVGGTDDAYIRGGMAAYRDYDGAGGAFGDTYVRSLTDDAVRSSVYGSVSGGDTSRVILVAINKASTPLRAAVRVRNRGNLANLRSYVVSAGNATPVAGATATASATNAFVYEMPPTSVSTLVLD